MRLWPQSLFGRLILLLVAVVGLVLSIAGVIGSALWVIAAIVAAVCALLFWRTVSK